MRGAQLKEWRKAKGITAKHVSNLTGYAQPHISKIEEKESITVEEFVAITAALGMKPGDQLPNSLDEIKPMMGIIEELKRFDPRSYPRLADILRALPSVLVDRPPHERTQPQMSLASAITDTDNAASNLSGSGRTGRGVVPHIVGIGMEPDRHAHVHARRESAPSPVVESEASSKARPRKAR